MEIVMQPENSNCCGQACVASILGITLEKSIKLFGKRGCTSTKDVVGAFKKMNVPCAKKLVLLKKGVEKSDVCMVVLHAKGTNHTHWVVFLKATKDNGFNRDLYIDPAKGIHCGYQYPQVWETSFLPIDVKIMKGLL